MKNSSIVVFMLWALLALLDIVALFANVPLVFGIIFGVLNASAILGGIPMLITEFRNRKYTKMMEEEPDNEL